MYYTIKDRNRDPSEHHGVTHPRQRASALGLALYHSQALLVQAGCTTVKSLLGMPYTIRGLSVNNRNAIQERSEREGLFVTDVAVSDRVLRGVAILILARAVHRLLPHERASQS